MKEILIVSICIVAFIFCLAGIVIGVWTAIAMICEAREKKPVVKKLSPEVNRLLSMD
jgi:hypothetical protein